MDFILLISDHGLFVSRSMALDVDGNREACDVAGHHLHVDGKGRCSAPVSLGTDTESVYFSKGFNLELRQASVPAVLLSQRSEECLLGEDRRLFHGAADTDADDGGWAGVRTRFPDPVHDEFPDPLDTRCGQEHRHGTHVLTAAALGHRRDPDAGTGDDLRMNDGGSVVARIRTTDRIGD